MDPEESDSEERTYETFEHILLPFPTLEKHSFRHNHFPYQEVELSVLQFPYARNVR